MGSEKELSGRPSPEGIWLEGGVAIIDCATLKPPLWLFSPVQWGAVGATHFSLFHLQWNPIYYLAAALCQQMYFIGFPEVRYGHRTPFCPLRCRKKQDFLKRVFIGSSSSREQSRSCPFCFASLLPGMRSSWLEPGQLSGTMR